MTKFITVSIAATLAASMFVLSSTAVAVEATAAPVRVTGEKVDSGLGDLPHYSQWADPTGKTVGQASVVADKKRVQAPSQRDDRDAQSLAVQVSQSK